MWHDALLSQDAVWTVKEVFLTSYGWMHPPCSPTIVHCSNDTASGVPCYPASLATLLIARKTICLPLLSSLPVFFSLFSQPTFHCSLQFNTASNQTQKEGYSFLNATWDACKWHKIAYAAVGEKHSKHEQSIYNESHSIYQVSCYKQPFQEWRNCDIFLIFFFLKWKWSKKNRDKSEHNGKNEIITIPTWCITINLQDLVKISMYFQFIYLKKN